MCGGTPGDGINIAVIGGSGLVGAKLVTAFVGAGMRWSQRRPVTGIHTITGRAG
jgi:hypothetical protein